MHLTFIVLGFYYAIAQVLLIREFLVIFYGNEVFIAFVFASWFLWIGIGSLVSARYSDRIKQFNAVFILLQILLPGCLFAQIVGIRVIRSFLDVSTAEILPLFSSVTIVCALTMPCSLLIGIIFPIGCRIHKEFYQSSGRSIGLIYIYETLGAVAGGLFFSLVLAGLMSHPAILLFLTFILMLNVSWYILRILKNEFKTKMIHLFLSISLLLAAVSLFCGISPVRKYLEQTLNIMRWKSIQPEITFIESQNSRFQNIAIGKRGNQYSLLGDGKFITSFPEEIEHAEFAAAVFAQKPSAQEVLLIGGGVEGLLREILAYPVRHIDYVEQDKKLFEMMRTYIHKKDKFAVKDRRVSLHFIDPRVFVTSLKQHKKYDLVIIRMPDPSSAALNRFYTEEFFKEINSILDDQGVLCTGALSAENYFGFEVAHYSGSIYHTLKGVFPYIAVSPGEKILFFAASAPDIVTSDHLLLKKRYQRIPLQERRFPPEGFRTTFEPERTQFVLSELEKSPPEINTDTKPITYYFNMLLWSNFSGSVWLKRLEYIRNAGMWIYCIPLFVIVVMRLIYAGCFPNRSNENRFNAFLSVGIIGFIAMGFQIMMIFMYQSFFGYIYERIGLVIGLFMAGLAGGAYVAQRLSVRINRIDLIMAVLMAIIGLFLLTLSNMIAQHIAEPVFYFIFCISGFFTGLMFPLAVNLYYQTAQKIGETAGMLDSADHGGAMLGALISGSLIVPLIGIQQSCIVLGSMALISSLPLLQSFFSRKRSQFTISFTSFPFWKTSWVITAGTVIIFSLSTIIRLHKKDIPVDFENTLLAEISGSTRFVYEHKPFSHYLGFHDDEHIDSVSLSSVGPAGDIWGYVGPINLLVSLSSNGNINRVSLIESQETPAYIQGLDEWLKKFNLKKVDALTGATVTINAIQRIVRKTVNRVNNEILKRPSRLSEDKQVHPGTQLLKDYRLYCMIILLGVSVWMYVRKGNTARKVITFINLLFFGFLMNLLITLVNIGNISVGWFPGTDNMIWLIFAGLVGIISLCWGQVFCGYICPFGILQEIFSYFHLTRSPHPWIDKRARYIKYVILAGTLCLFWISGDGRKISFNPMNYIFSSNVSTIILIATGFIAVCSVFFTRFWCRYFCPTGAFLSFFNKIELFKRYAPEKKYSHCDLGVENKTDIDCIKCNRCRFTAYEQD